MNDTIAGRADERTTELSRRLQLAVELDTSGWLQDGIEIRFTLAAERTLLPMVARVGSEVSIDKLLAHGSVVARFARYNDALNKLRCLQKRFAVLVARGRTALEAGSAVWCANQALLKLEIDIVGRQTARMGSNVVNLVTLDAEIAFFENYHRYLASVTTSAEDAERARMCNEDTLELESTDD